MKDGVEHRALVAAVGASPPRTRGRAPACPPAATAPTGGATRPLRPPPPCISKPAVPVVGQRDREPDAVALAVDPGAPIDHAVDAAVRGQRATRGRARTRCRRGAGRDALTLDLGQREARQLQRRPARRSLRADGGARSARRHESAPAQSRTQAIARTLGISSPDQRVDAGVHTAAGGAADELQLRALIVGRQAVAFVRGREAALRAERQPLERDDSATPRRCAARGRRPAPSCGLFELTSPSTTTRSSGTCRSGSNVPDRSSSYSSRKRWKRAR